MSIHALNDLSYSDRSDRTDRPEELSGLHTWNWHARWSSQHIYSWPLLELGNPNCMHTTLASVLSQLFSQTVPHWLFLQISTRPSVLTVPWSLTLPWMQPIHMQLKWGTAGDSGWIRMSINGSRWVATHYLNLDWWYCTDRLHWCLCWSAESADAIFALYLSQGEWSGSYWWHTLLLLCMDKRIVMITYMHANPWDFSEFSVLILVQKCSMFTDINCHYI